MSTDSPSMNVDSVKGGDEAPSCDDDGHSPGFPSPTSPLHLTRALTR